jgi:hypothetical protein
MKGMSLYIHARIARPDYDPLPRFASRFAGAS